MKPARMLRRVVFVFAAMALGYLAARAVFTPPAPPPLLRATLLPETVRLPDLDLTDQDGRRFGREALTGHWTIVFFGFTSCPDVCPTTLTTLVQVARQLQDVPVADRPRVLLITVDPEKDDPERLRAYVRAFDPEFLAASGTQQAISRTAQAFGLGYARIVRPDGTYTVEHGSSLFVVGPSGGLVATSSTPHDVRMLASDYRQIVEHVRARDRAFSPARLFARRS
jgi:protein SCO1/2